MSNQVKTDLGTDALIELAQLLCQTVTFSEVLRLVSQKAATFLNAETCSILMINPLSRETIKSVHHEGRTVKSDRYRPVQNQVSGWMIKNRCSFLTEDIGRDRRFKVTRLKESNPRSMIGVLLVVDGMPIGTLILQKKYRDASFTEDELSFLEKFASIVSPFLYNAEKIQMYFSPPIPAMALIEKYKDVGLIGKSEPFVEMLTGIEAAIKSDVRILLQGASGTGKELVARAIHNLSARHPQPFVAVDCGAIPSSLVESELFGHVRGAFTGANTDRKGLFEKANGGTLFLDEIANLPFDIQSKLLRVLQENEVRPVGSDTSKKINVRVVSASSQALQELINEGRFRQDLFFRLHVFPIYVPSLSERKKDIPLLVDFFIKEFSAQQKKEVGTFAPVLLDFVKHREWPGNVRELENFVERIIVLSPDSVKQVDVEVLPRDLQKDFKEFLTKHAESDELSLIKTLASYEKDIMVKTLVALNWNQSKAARKLAISEANLRFRMKRLGILRPKEIIKETPGPEK